MKEDHGWLWCCICSDWPVYAYGELTAGAWNEPVLNPVKRNFPANKHARHVQLCKKVIVRSKCELLSLCCGEALCFSTSTGQKAAGLGTFNISEIHAEHST